MNRHSQPEYSDELPLVLTATIIPNVSGATVANPQTRLIEYRRMLQFCQQFAPVIFLENSNYPLEQHPEFNESARLRVHRFAPSSHSERGKGFQEFEMLDAWLAGESQPPQRWLKITGRYFLSNLGSFLTECRREKNFPLLIDQQYRHCQARTHLFSVTTEFYEAHIKNLYRQCDDRTGDWIERVLFRELKGLPDDQMRLFRTQPRFDAHFGSTGRPFPAGKFQWLVKQSLRRLNTLVDKRFLRYI